MNNKAAAYIFLLLTSFFTILVSARNPDQPIADVQIKIACVGNSITYGSTIVNREKNAYPRQLQAMLGKEYEIRNFGVSGTTLLKNGNHPYWNTLEYEDAKNFAPDILFVKLGTNDSKLGNRSHLDEFNDNYIELIQSFKQNNDEKDIYNKYKRHRISY